MKKLLYLIAVACVLFGFTSCNKDKKIDVDYNVTVTLNPSTVVSGFELWQSDDLDLTGSAKLRLQLFVYDKDGKLVCKDEKNVAGYSSNASFKMMLPEGEYTFLASSNVVNPRQDTPEIWGFSLVEEINNIKIDKVSEYIEGKKEILGLKLIKKTISKSETFTIDILSATALVNIAYDSFNYWQDVVQYRIVCYNKNNTVRVSNNEFIYSNPSSNWVNVVTPDIGYDGYIGYMALLPNTDLDFHLVAFFDQSTYTEVSEAVQTLVGGQQYFMLIDIPTLDITISSINKSNITNNNNKKYNSSSVLDIIANNPNLYESSLK